jgi:hypothetical protein
VEGGAEWQGRNAGVHWGTGTLEFVRVSSDQTKTSGAVEKIGVRSPIRKGVGVASRADF